MATQTKKASQKADTTKSQGSSSPDPRAQKLAESKTQQANKDLQQSVNPSANPNPTPEQNTETPIGFPEKTSDGQAQRTKALHGLSKAVRDATGHLSHNEIRHHVNREVVAIEAGEGPREDPIAPGHALVD